MAEPVTPRLHAAFSLEKATNATMASTRAGLLFLRLATVDTARLSHFQAEERAKKKRAEVAAAAKNGLKPGENNDPLGVGLQMERERKAQERAQQGDTTQAAQNTIMRGSSKSKSDNEATALSMGQIFETCSVTFETFMQACFYSLNNGFTQVDAWRSFRSAVATTSTSSSWDENNGSYTVSIEQLSVDEIASARLSVKPFYMAMQHAATTFKANLEGQELLDPSSLQPVQHDEVERFAATLSASLPEPILMEQPIEGYNMASDATAEGKLAASKTKNSQKKIKKSTREEIKEKDQGKKDTVREDITATLGQYLSPIQQRLLSAPILSLLELYQHGVRQLFVSYMTDDILSGEPPPWSEICIGQLQLKPNDTETCMCALRVVPDLIPHRQLKVMMLDLSPISGSLLFPQFIELLWRSATSSPLAKDQIHMGLSDRDILQALLSHTGLQDDMPMDIPGFGSMGGAARRREDAMRVTSAAHANHYVPADPLSPRSTFFRGSDDMEVEYGAGHRWNKTPSIVSQEDRSLFKDAGDNDVRAELGLRSLLDSLESSLSSEEEVLRQVPGFGFPAATEFAPRKIDSSAAAYVWHPMPCVLREVCRAPKAPLEVENLMESALAYHNSSQYDLAINAYIAARTAWLNSIELIDTSSDTLSKSQKGDDDDDEGFGDGEIEPRKNQGKDIPARATIFILCSIGSVHESAGNDEMALACYLDAQRTALAQLSHDDADMAVTFSHLGSVCYHLGRFSTSARCFRVAVSIRLHILGREHPDTAASHSSLGAALCMLGPDSMVEAMYNFKLAAKMLTKHLGPTHPRSVVAKRNLDRARARPSKFILRQDSDEDGLMIKSIRGSQMPRTLELRDDESRMRPGGQMAAFSGAPGKKKKGKKGGKKKKK